MLVEEVNVIRRSCVVRCAVLELIWLQVPSHCCINRARATPASMHSQDAANFVTLGPCETALPFGC